MGKSILIVGDEGAATTLWRKELSRRRYRISVSDWEGSQKAAEQLHPDLIVVDVALPTDICIAHCHTLGQLGNAPVLLLSDQETTRREGRLYITPRPQLLAPLLAAMENALQDANVWTPEAGDVLKAGDITLDVGKRLLIRGEEKHWLSPKQFQLLHMLMSNPGQVLSRRQLIRAIWDTDYMGDTRTLYVHVRWLRLKVEKDPSNPQYIRTVRGVGYRFTEPETGSPPTPG